MISPNRIFLLPFGGKPQTCLVSPKVLWFDYVSLKYELSLDQTAWNTNETYQKCTLKHTLLFNFVFLRIWWFMHGEILFSSPDFFVVPKPTGFTLRTDCSVGYRLVANQDFFFFLPVSHVSRVPRVSLFSMPVPCIPTQPYSRCCPPHPSNCACDVFVFFVFFHFSLHKVRKKHICGCKLSFV